MNPYARHADDTSDYGLIDPAAEPAFIDPQAADAALAGAPEVDLSEDPFADDLSERLDAVAPRRWTSRTTLALSGIVLLVGGFVGGAQVQKHWGTTSSSTASPGFVLPSGNPFAGGNFGRGGTGTGGTGTGGNGTGGARTGGTGGAGGGGTTGTVKLVDGTTVYLTTPDGQTVIVKTTPSTTVNVNQPGSLTDLAPGATVTIQGQTGSDGSVNATSITKTK
jgi:hypothetical protein